MRLTRLGAYIRSAGISQGALGQATGISRWRIGRLCRGVNQPSPMERRQIAEQLQAAEYTLFDEFASLDVEAKAQAKLARWIGSSEGALFVRRLRQIFVEE